MVSARVVFVVVLELLGGGRLTKVEGEGVEHVLLGVGKGRVLRDLGPAELCVSDGRGHLGGFLCGALCRSEGEPEAFSAGRQLLTGVVVHVFAFLISLVEV